MAQPRVRAIDTNILVRWITRDDPVQTPLADAILSEPFFVPLTVLIGTIWVIGGKTYRYTPVMIREALRTLIDLHTATIPARAWVYWAFDRHEAGADLPDMLHMIASQGASTFSSFEKHLRDDAGDAPPLPVGYVT